MVVRVAGQVLAETGAALRLTEASYPPVFYIPRADANMALLTPSDHHTYCPYKGAVSTGRCNTGVKPSCRGLEVQGLSRALV